MRAFVGLPVPASWAAPLGALRDRVDAGRPVPDENLHLTLAFLDEQTAETVEMLDEGLRARTLRACRLQPAGLTVFGEKRPRLMALAVERNPELDALHDAVRGAAREAGIELERRRFRPHVTLRRFRAGMDDEAKAGLAAALDRLSVPREAAAATCMTLWRSILRPDGPIYEELAEYPLIPRG